MNKLIAKILIFCMLLCTLSMPAFASAQRYVVTGSFDGASSGDSVSIFVLKDNVTMDSLADASGSIMDRVYLVNAGITNADGSFAINITINPDALENTCVLTCNGVRQIGTLRSYIKSENIHYIYVSPTAAGGSGTLADPYGSIASALDDAKSITAEGCSAEIKLMGGEYRLTERLQLYNVNNTNPDARIRISPASEEDKVVLSGMKHLPADMFTKVTDSQILAKIPENARGKVYSIDLLSAGFTKDQISFMYSLSGGEYGSSVIRSAKPPVLYLNGKRQRVAQYPNEGWLSTTQVGNESDGSPWLISPEAVPDSWSNAYISGFLLESYRVKYGKIESIEGDKLILDGSDTLWSNDNTGDGIADYGPRFVISNILETMDMPGEWCIDEAAGVMYYFAPHTITDEDVLEIPYLDDVIFVSRTNSLTLENLEIKGSRTSNAIYAGNVDNLKILNCSIHAAATNGIFVSNGTDTLIDGCNVYDTGARGIHVYGGADIQNLIPGNNTVSNNHVYDYSNNPSLGSNNMGIALGRGDNLASMGDVAEHNLIHGSKFAGAVIYGGMDNTVRLNEMYNVISDTEDAGVVYSGRRWNEYGNLVSNNFIHDYKNNYTQRYRNRAIYWDDYQSGQTAEGNIIVSDGTIGAEGILSIGSDNVIRGNIFYNVPSGISLSDRNSWTLNFAPGEFPYNSFADMPPVGYEHYDEITALKNKIDADPTHMVYDALAENNLLVDSTMNVSAGLYQGKDINNVVLSGVDVFASADDMNYTIKADIAGSYGLTEDIPTEDKFDMDSIGIQKDVPFTDHEFELMYPANGGKVSDDKIFLTWEQAVFADRYDYVIATDASLSNVVSRGSTRETFVSAELQNGTYYWQVKAVNTSRNMGTEWYNSNSVHSFTVTDGMPLEFIDAGTNMADTASFDVNYTLYNKSSSAEVCTVIAAVYAPEEDVLIASKTLSGESVDALAAKSGKFSFNLSETPEKIRIKVFAFSSLQELVPVSYHVELKGGVK